MTETTRQTTTLFCANHPERETLLRCGRCDKPICSQCQVRHPVGIRCRDCARIRKDPLYTLAPTHYALAFVSALGASTLGGFVAPYLGFFFAFFVAPLIGGMIAEFVGRVIGYKRGLPLQIMVGVCIVLGVVIARYLAIFALQAIPPGTPLGASALVAIGLSSVFGSIVYIVFAIVGAVARLR